MQTFSEQREFFKGHWPSLRSALEQRGAAGAISLILNDFSDDLERRVMFVFARQGMVMGDWPGRDLDNYIPFCEAAIAECLRQAAEAADDETRRARINTANIISYNLGADMAFCWGDDLRRTRAHFERGLQAARDCIRWRTELGNPPSTLNMAHWLAGVHCLALGDPATALADFEASLEFHRLDAATQSTVSDGKSAMLLFCLAWVELARCKLDGARARGGYEELLEGLRELTGDEDEETASSAAFFITQLESADAQAAGA